jgi:serine/threonine-protein kinase
MSAGMPTDALQAVQRLGAGPRRLYLEAIGQHSLGNDRASEAALGALVDDYAQEWAYQVAEVYGWRRERDEAFEWLERARVQHDVGLRSAATDPFLKSLRDDPRWRPFLEKLKGSGE